MVIKFLNKEDQILVLERKYIFIILEIINGNVSVVSGE